jgi:ribonuclease HI
MANRILVYCDGGARGNPGPAAAAIVVEKDGKVIHKESKYLGRGTNNEAEYSGAILGLGWVQKNMLIEEGEIVFVMDSQLVANQLSGKFKVKNENLRNRFFSAKAIEKKIPTRIIYQSVSRERNKIADFLVNKELDENS